MLQDRLHTSAYSLSGGQQQRLCIARAIALNPKILLMDEPCSSLDPIATRAIEELIGKISKETTIVIVTHNMQQAKRISSYTGFFLTGNLMEYGPTEKIFYSPVHEKTKEYIAGEFG